MNREKPQTASASIIALLIAMVLAFISIGIFGYMLFLDRKFNYFSATSSSLSDHAVRHFEFTNSNTVELSSRDYSECYISPGINSHAVSSCILTMSEGGSWIAKAKANSKCTVICNE